MGKDKPLSKAELKKKVEESMKRNKSEDDFDSSKEDQKWREALNDPKGSSEK